MTMSPVRTCSPAVRANAARAISARMRSHSARAAGFTVVGTDRRPQWFIAGAVRGTARVAAPGNLVGVSVTPASSSPASRRVALLTLGCARNEVDSEELAARLDAGGWQVRTTTNSADVVLVNTCGFVDKAKQDSIDSLLAAADTGAKVVAAGCGAERGGKELADSLPEASAVLGFDDYTDIATRLAGVLAGEEFRAHTPRDRRELLPITPVQRQGAKIVVPGHATPDLA